MSFEMKNLLKIHAKTLIYIVDSGPINLYRISRKLRIGNYSYSRDHILTMNTFGLIKLINGERQIIIKATEKGAAVAAHLRLIYSGFGNIGPCED